MGKHTLFLHSPHWLNNCHQIKSTVIGHSFFNCFNILAQADRRRHTNKYIGRNHKLTQQIHCNSFSKYSLVIDSNRLHCSARYKKNSCVNLFSLHHKMLYIMNLFSSIISLKWAFMVLQNKWTPTENWNAEFINENLKFKCCGKTWDTICSTVIKNNVDLKI